MKIYIAYEKTLTKELPKRAKVIHQASSLAELIRKLKYEGKEAAIWECESYRLDDDEEMYVKNERFVRVV